MTYHKEINNLIVKYIIGKVCKLKLRKPSKYTSTFQLELNMANYTQSGLFIIY